MQIQLQVIMSMTVVTGNEETTVGDALRLMEKNQIHHLPIVRPGRDGGLDLVSIVTHRDLLHVTSVFIGTRAEEKKDRATMEVHLKGLMKTFVYTLPPTATVKEAVALMLKRKIGCIPIIERGRSLVGIVTVTDMLRILDDFLP